MSDQEPRYDDFMSALAAGAMAADPRKPANGEREYAVVPDGYSLRDLEPFEAQPTAKRGTVDLEARDSLIAYVNAHKGAGSGIFAEPGAHRVTAVLDHHEPNRDAASEPQFRMTGWGRHRAVLTLPLDPDWKLWTKHNDTVMEQMQFAQLVEDLLPTIKVPDGADLLELAQHLEQTVNVAFKSAERLADGRRQLTYAEEAVNKLGNARIELPEEFKIRCPVYFRTEPVDLTAKLRVRTKGTEVLLGYHLHRPEETVERAFQDVLGVIAKETEIAPLIGAPPEAFEYRFGA